MQGQPGEPDHRHRRASPTSPATLAKQKDALAEMLDAGPVALSNLQNAYNPASGTLDTRDNAQQLDDPGAVPVLAADLARASPRASATRSTRSSKNKQLPDARRQRLPAAGRRPRPHPRRHPRGHAVSGPRGCAPTTAAALLCAGCLTGVRGHLRPAAARAARRPAATPTGSPSSSPTSSTWCRSRRSRSTTSPSAPSRTSRWTAGTRGSRCGCRTRCSCRTTRSPSCARPACSARSSSRCRRPPARAAAGRLGDGDTIPLRRSGRNPEVEEVLSALSLLLNGGGVAQLKTINVELTRAMAGPRGRHQGRDPPARHLRRRPGRAQGRDRAGPRRAGPAQRPAGGPEGATSRRPSTTSVPGLKVLADQRAQLTRMLTALSDLGRVGTRVVNAQQGRHGGQPAGPRSRSSPSWPRPATTCPSALEMLVTYPFPQAATGAVQGDFTNLRITADLDLRTILTNLNGGKDPGLPTLPPVPNPTGRRLPTVTLPQPSRCPRSRCRSRVPDVDARPCRCRPTPAWPAICIGSARPGTTSRRLRHQPGPADAGGPDVIRRGVKVQLVVFAADHRASGSATSAPATSGWATCCPASGYVVTADFAESGGIFENAEVTYRGRRRRPGRPAPARRRRRARRPAARATAPRCPRDTDAVVENRSAVGEQYVDLQPRPPGRAVPRRRRPDRQRRGPARRCTTETLLLNLDRLVNSVDRARPGRGHRRAGQGLLGHRSGPAAAAGLRRRPDPGRGRRPARDHPADRGRADRAGHPARVRLGDQELLRRPGRPQRHPAHQRRRPAQGPRQRRRRLPASCRR